MVGRALGVEAAADGLHEQAGPVVAGAAHLVVDVREADLVVDVREGQLAARAPVSEAARPEHGWNGGEES